MKKHLLFSIFCFLYVNKIKNKTSHEKHFEIHQAKSPQ